MKFCEPEKYWAIRKSHIPIRLQISLLLRPLPIFKKIYARETELDKIYYYI